MYRLASMCPQISHLQLSGMYYLSEAGRLSMVSLFRQIIHHNPPIQVLNMKEFSFYEDVQENIGELVLETLLSSNVDTITDLDLSKNSSWFKKPEGET